MGSREGKDQYESKCTKEGDFQRQTWIKFWVSRCFWYFSLVTMLGSFEIFIFEFLFVSWRHFPVGCSCNISADVTRHECGLDMGIFRGNEMVQT